MSVIGDKIKINWNGSETPYVILRDESDQVWNDSTQAVEAWVDGNTTRAQYALVATAAGGGQWTVTIPAALPENQNWIATKWLRAGVAVDTGDDNLTPDEAFYWNGTASAPSDPSSAAGIYADDSDLEDWYGRDNIDEYSDLQNAGNRDNARIQKWLTKADDWINLEFKRAGRDTPIAEDADDFSALSDVAAEWAGAMLAKGRGDIPRGWSKRDDFDSAMDGHIERATDRLKELVAAWVDLEGDDEVDQAGTFENVPLTFGDPSTTDEFTEA